MSDSFRSATFNVLRQGAQRNAPGRVNVHEIPGGDNFYVDLAGKSPKHTTLVLYVLGNAALTALESEVDKSGTLTYYRGSFSVVLDHVDSGEPEWDTVSGDYVYECTAEFIFL